jgi:hypothetical protein
MRTQNRSSEEEALVETQGTRGIRQAGGRIFVTGKADLIASHDEKG